MLKTSGAVSSIALVAAALAALLLTSSAHGQQPAAQQPAAQQPEDRLTIVTSFSKDLTAPYAQAFQKKYPGTRVDVQNRNTAAAVAFIRETRSSPPDIMWASAPDAFEVLKKKSLLQKYKPKAQGHRRQGRRLSGERSGRLLRRLCRVRLRHHVQHALRAGEQAAGAEGVGRPQEADLFRPCRRSRRRRARAPRISPSRPSCRAKAGTRAGRRLRRSAATCAQVSDRSFGVPDAVNSGQIRPRHRHRLLRPLRQGLGLSGEVRLSVGDHDRAGQCRHHRQRQEPEGGRGLRRVPAVGGRPADPARSENPAPAGAARDLRQGAGRLSQSVQGREARCRLNFNVDVSEGRYELVDSLYDRLITFRLKELNAAWKAIHDAESKLGSSASAEAKRLARAKRASSPRPCRSPRRRPRDKAIAGAFQEVKPGRRRRPPGRVRGAMGRLRREELRRGEGAGREGAGREIAVTCR